MNMNQPVQCLRCKTQMESGFVADLTYGGYQQQNWSAGEPKLSIWTGLKVKKDQTVSVVTFRCPNCGYLESYANTHNG